MRVLVVGSVPPPAGRRAASLLAEVLSLRSDGHEVEVVSLNALAAAHRYLAAGGLPAVIEVGLAARRFDAIIVQLEPGLPVRAVAGRSERAAALLALGAALRAHPDVRLRLDHLDDLPYGPGGRAALELWKSAARIDVGDEATGDQLRAVLGPMAERVSISQVTAEPSGQGSKRGDSSVWGDGADVTAESVTAVVRRLAAAERVALAERARPGGSSSRVPLWQWLPAPGAGVPLVANGGPGAGTASVPGAAAASAIARRTLIRVLAGLERRPATRPIAHLARSVRASVRDARAPGARG